MPLVPEPLRFEARLLHAEGTCRVVKVSGYGPDGAALGSALAEATSVEAAEDQALQRLQRRLAPPPPPAGQQTKAQPPAPQPTVPVPPREPPLEPPPPPVAQPAEPLPDPEDWSDELAAIDAELQRLGWGRSQEGAYLQRWLGHASRSRITTYTDLSSYLHSLRQLSDQADPAGAAVPLRRSDLVAQCDQLLASLGWSAAQGRQLLVSHFAAQSRSQLNDQQLLAFNLLLEAELLQAPQGHVVDSNQDQKDP